jgi:hypothetical protein
MSTATKSAPIPPSRQREKPGQTLKWIAKASSASRTRAC